MKVDFFTQILSGILMLEVGMTSPGVFTRMKAHVMGITAVELSHSR